MEALVEAALHSDTLSLEITNTQCQSSSDSEHSKKGLRHVTEKLLPSRQYQTGLLSTDSKDSFTGWIDAVTGVPVWGVRHYQLTGEWYDGSFDEQGLRLQGTVHNVFLPSPVPAIPDLLGQFRKTTPDELFCAGETKSRLSFQLLYGAQYRKGILEFGTLITNRVLYRGSFVHQRFHGRNCEWISLGSSADDVRKNDNDATSTVTTTTTTTYIGDFQQGFFHGNGIWQQSILTTTTIDDDFEVEEEEEIHSYTGHFRNGMKHGQGRYTIRKLLKKKKKKQYKEEETKSNITDDADETFPTSNNSDDDNNDDDDDDDDDDQNQQKKWIQFIIHDAESNLSSTRSKISSETILKQLEHVFPLAENILTYRTGTSTNNILNDYTYIYKGSFYGNVRQGEGLEQVCGDVYQGQFKNNQRHGHGCLQQKAPKTEGNNNMMNVYYGKWNQGEPCKTRYWTINTASNEMYLGQMVQWKPHGYGVLYTELMTQMGTFHHGILQNGLTAHATKGTEFTFQPASMMTTTTTTTASTTNNKNNLELLETLGEIAETLQVKNHDFPLREDYHDSLKEEKAAAESSSSSETTTDDADAAAKNTNDDDDNNNQFNKGKQVFGRKILAQAVASSIRPSLHMIAANAEQYGPEEYYYYDDESASDSDAEDNDNDSSHSMQRARRRGSLSMNEIFNHKQQRRYSNNYKGGLAATFSMASLHSSTSSNMSSMMNSFSSINAHSSTMEPEATPESSSSPSSSSNNNNNNQNNNSNQMIQLHSYANGDMYLGRLRQQTKHRFGVGVHVSRNGGSYVGFHEHHKRHGYGVLRKSDGKQQYAGTFCSGKKHGPVGTLMNKVEQYYYHGGFNMDVLEGKKGILVHNFAEKEQEKYDVYIGEWKAGQYHGYGIHITTMDDNDDLDGSEMMNRGMVEIYQGYFRHGLRNGKGTLITKDISSNQSFEILYCGQWQNDDYHGFGIEKISSGRYYEGQFHNGEKHGYGVMKHLKSGDCYQGYWEHDHPSDGKWRIQFSNGNLYHGQAQVLMTSIFDNDEDDITIPLKLQGFGTMQYYNGDVYVGEFQNTQRHGLGYGITTSQSWEGTWQDDIETEKDGILTLRSDGSIHYKGRNEGLFSNFCRLGTPPARLQYWEQDHIMNLIMS